MKPNNRRLSIAALFIALGEFYRVEVTRGQAEMYAKAVEDIPLEDIRRAMEAVQRTSKFFPMPVDIREAALGSAKDEAQEAAGRIVEAMGRFGYTNPERARQFIGELGWRVVEREGGWQSICQRTNSEDLPILKAQWRELAAATLRRVGTGNDNRAPAIGIKAPKTPELTFIGAMLPKIIRDEKEPA